MAYKELFLRTRYENTVYLIDPIIINSFIFSRRIPINKAFALNILSGKKKVYPLGSFSFLCLILLKIYN